MHYPKLWTLYANKVNVLPKVKGDVLREILEKLRESQKDIDSLELNPGSRT